MAWVLTTFGKEEFGRSNLLNFLNTINYELPKYHAIQKTVRDMRSGSKHAGMFISEGMGIGAFYRVGSKIKWTRTWEAKKNDPVVAIKK